LTYLVILAAFLWSCGRPPTSTSIKPEVRFGVALNDIRKANGIPLLDASWKVIYSTNDTLDWSPPTRTPLRVAAYDGKTTEFSGGKITREKDVYSDGRTYDWVDPDRPTETRNCLVIITFDFSKSKAGLNPWTYDYVEGNGFEKLTEQAAEDKLKAAGLKRRNY
jgi:hypothetical protein